MRTPFEDLEYLADFLPEEGESIVVSRQYGELRCESIADQTLRDGVDDADLYGRMVQMNERLNACGAMPIWVTTFVWFWSSVMMYTVGGLDWTHWYVSAGLGLLAVYGCFHWIRHQQHRLFVRELRPLLQRELSRHQIEPYELLAGVRQHVEFRTLLDELIRWQPESRRGFDERA